MAQVEFNFKAPVARADGGINIEPNFSLETGLINKALATARNSECPTMIKEAGGLSLAEHTSIQYHRLRSKVGVWVEAPGDEDERPTAMSNAIKLREMLLERGTGKYSKHSAIEVILAGRDFTSDDHKARRSYPLGMGVNSQEDDCGMELTNAAMLRNREKIAEVARLCEAISREILEEIAPQDVLDRLKKRAAIDVPMVIGSEKNYLTTRTTSDDGLFFSLSNNLPGYWPGRAIISSLRIYAVIAPFTALIFKGVHPHKSFGSVKMTGSTRPPYVPSVPNVPSLDPEKYIHARLMVVNYPKESIVEKSPLMVRTRTSKLLQGPQNLPSDNPQALPSALMAFGTLRNRHEWLARKDAWSAAQVLDGNTLTLENAARDKADAEWHKKCRSHLSMHTFTKNGKGNLKVGDIIYVEVDQLGSSFTGMDPNIADTNSATKWKQLALREEYGPQQFACFHCDKRYTSIPSHKTHFDTKPPEFEYRKPSPSRNPNCGGRGREYCARDFGGWEGGDWSSTFVEVSMLAAKAATMRGRKKRKLDDDECVESPDAQMDN
ncbi:uncharacterized protein PAC_13633 [Phialocephala subalpina]|uniref:Uncharacterized protein n=1 Tax=Phialocephala subalpina TaxID=576137 RepID=A0A1L7XFI8_9HELO|nr:uncharacterized protein PAC_13633 [Phialocephala subalpina]